MNCRKCIWFDKSEDAINLRVLMNIIKGNQLNLEGSNISMTESHQFFVFSGSSRVMKFIEQVKELKVPTCLCAWKKCFFLSIYLGIVIATTPNLFSKSTGWTKNFQRAVLIGSFKYKSHFLFILKKSSYIFVYKMYHWDYRM